MNDLGKNPVGGETTAREDPGSGQNLAGGRNGWSSFSKFLIPLAVVAVVGGCIVLATQKWDRWTASEAFQITDNAYVRAELTRLSARVSGNVRQITVSDFQNVKKGDLLLEIEPADYQVKVSQAQASLDAASAQLENLSNQEKLQRAAIQQVEAQLQAATVSAQLATQEAVRQRDMSLTGITTKQKLEQADADEQKTAAAANASRASLVSARAQLDVVAGQRGQLAANVDAAKASLNAAKLSLSYTRIVAPFDGVASEMQVHVGDYVSVGTSLLTVVPLPNVYVTANFKETQLARMAVGQKVDITVDTFPGKKFQGHVEGLSPASGSQFALLPADNATGNFTKVTQRIPVRIAFDDAQETLEVLKPGMSAVVTVEVGSP